CPPHVHSQCPICTRDVNLEIGRAGVAATAGHRSNRPLLLDLTHVVPHAHVEVAFGPSGRNHGGILRRNHVSCSGKQASASSFCPGRSAPSTATGSPAT